MRIVLRFASVFFLVPSLFGQAPLPVSTNNDATIPPAKASAAVPGLVPQKEKAPTTELASTTPIVTLKGLCDAAPAFKTARATAAKTARTGVNARPKTCQTVITKGQMDDLLDMLIPGATPEQRSGFALNYIRLLAASQVALEKRLDHDPVVAKEVEARTQFTRMQVMAGSLYHRVEALAEDVKDSEIQSYYSGNQGNFLQGEVQRILLPKAVAGGAPVDLAKLKGKAEELRARAAKGEDFDQLQHEAYLALNPNGSVPPTKLATVHRTSLPSAERSVFDLRPGEVTPVVDTQGALEILKLVSAKPVPLETVREEIKIALTNGHLLLLMKDATQDVTANFNLAYLELPKAPELFLPPSLHQRARAGGNGGTQGATNQGAMNQGAMNSGGRRPATDAMPPSSQSAAPAPQH